MIEELRIQNFKSHKNTSINLKNLTVLCGQNGVGKSSLIQALLLLRQTNLKSRLETILDLNDPLCFIGKTKDALYQFADKKFGDEIAFVLKDSGTEYSWIFDASKESTFLNRISDSQDSSGYEQLALFTNDFQYVSASRNQESRSDDYSVNILKQISLKEGKAELTAHFLHFYQKSQKVLSELLHENEEDEYLLSQVTAWEREVSQGVNIIPEQVGDRYEIKYSFDTNGYGPTEAFSQQNVGYGLSYSLPIIVSILASETGNLLLIENPEAHIHPYGQAKLAELICLAANAGVQIIVETHSDHIINGILVQCKRFEKEGIGIEKGKVKMYQLDREVDTQSTICNEIEVESGGRIKNRPTGFFDQTGKDLRRLI